MTNTDVGYVKAPEFPCRVCGKKVHYLYRRFGMCGECYKEVENLEFDDFKVKKKEDDKGG